MLSDKELSEFCKAAALLFDNGYSGPARALLGSVLMHPSLDPPAKESQEEGSSEPEDPDLRRTECSICGSPLASNNKSGVCTPCTRAGLDRPKRYCATPGCETTIKKHNRLGWCRTCYAEHKNELRRKPKIRDKKPPREKVCHRCKEKFTDESAPRNRRYCDRCGTATAAKADGSYYGHRPGGNGKPDPWRVKENWQKALNTDAHQVKELDEGLLAAGWTWDAELDRWRM